MTDHATDHVTSAVLDRDLRLHPQVALRPESFGALAYHYGTRRLVFLKHPDIVRLIEVLAEHDSVRAALVASDVDEARWPAFCSALSSLLESEMLDERARAHCHATG
ncbi:MAG: mycofactocin biosynthesis chaperone MftB [Ilumatobacteraceae bacterium]